MNAESENARFGKAGLTAFKPAFAPRISARNCVKLHLQIKGSEGGKDTLVSAVQRHRAYLGNCRSHNFLIDSSICPGSRAMGKYARSSLDTRSLRSC